MGAHHLIVLCGVPGSGKSTLAQHLIGHWDAIGFASETFADELGPAARTSSGDLTRQAIAHAYTAMAVAVRASLATRKLVVTVGSFRAEQQRRRFREIANDTGAAATVLRISCPAELAAERVRLRLAHGEHGPTETTIRQIDAELNQARDIDGRLTNDTSIDHFLRRADAIVKFAVRRSDLDPPATPLVLESFEHLAAGEFAFISDLVERLRSEARDNASAAVEQELDRSRARIEELRHCLLSTLPTPTDGNLVSDLERATSKWVSKVYGLQT